MKISTSGQLKSVSLYTIILQYMTRSACNSEIKNKAYKENLCNFHIRMIQLHFGVEYREKITLFSVPAPEKVHFECMPMKNPSRQKASFNFVFISVLLFNRMLTFYLKSLKISFFIYFLNEALEALSIN